MASRSNVFSSRHEIDQGPLLFGVVNGYPESPGAMTSRFKPGGPGTPLRMTLKAHVPHIGVIKKVRGCVQNMSKQFTSAHHADQAFEHVDWTLLHRFGRAILSQASRHSFPETCRFSFSCLQSDWSELCKASCFHMFFITI